MWGPPKLDAKLNLQIWCLLICLKHFYIFHMFPSIVTYDFDIILGSFFGFWGPKQFTFLGVSVKSKTLFGVYSYILTTFVV